MGFEVSNNNDWVVLSIEDRIDSFNYDDFKSEMEKLVDKKKARVALKLNRAQFLSLSSIKYFSDVARRLEQKGGKLALLGTPEKLKRQIHIFASLKSFALFRSEEEWHNDL